MIPSPQFPRSLLALAFVLGLAACQREAPPADEAATGPDPRAASAADPAPGDGAGPAAEDAAPERPSLRVATLDHGDYDLAEHRGRWVVVNFWATWCAPCLVEMPELSALAAMREHVEVVGLAYEEIDEAAMREFLAERPVVYPIAIVDVYAPPADFETPRGLPMTYLVGPDGAIVRQFLGPVTALEIEQAIAAAGGPPAPEAPAHEAGGDAA